MQQGHDEPGASGVCTYRQLGQADTRVVMKWPFFKTKNPKNLYNDPTVFWKYPVRKSNTGSDHRGTDPDTAKRSDHPHPCSVNTVNMDLSHFNGCAAPQLCESKGWKLTFFFFFGGEGQSVMPGRPAWWITSELHTLIRSLLYQSLGVNTAPAFTRPDTTLRLCVTMWRAETYGTS